MIRVNFKEKNIVDDRTGRRDLRDSTFLASESGTFTILTLSLILIVFGVVGFAVDIMRYDRERARLQYALDRAVLAAADLDQDLCPADVVKDYLEKDGLVQYLVGEPVVTPTECGSAAVKIEGYRRVEATARMDVQTHFMDWWGVPYMATNAVSVAEEAIGDVEISMVLDVSGSMRWNSRLDNLKVGAHGFVDELLAKSADGNVSISIVPYSEQVSIPDYLISELNTVGTNRHANCIDFAGSDFTTMGINAYDTVDPDTGDPIAGSTLPRTMHFISSVEARTNGWTVPVEDKRPFGTDVLDAETCLPDTSTTRREITILEKDPVVLKKRITDLHAQGWTSIDVGLKWGLALLDESFQPLTQRMVDNNHLPKIFENRPVRNNSADTLKILILMTDGDNTYQYKVNPPYNEGTSDIWWNDEADTYSFRDPNAGNFVWPDIPINEYDYSNRWYWVRADRQPHAYGEGVYVQYRCTWYSRGRCRNVDYGTSRESPENGDSVELMWHDVWETTTQERIRQLLERAFGYTYATNWSNAAVSQVDASQKNPRVQQLCNLAENQNVIIFAIAYEAPSGVKQILKDCATADGAYYEASGPLLGVFASIGATVQNLRLTQ